MRPIAVSGFEGDRANVKQLLVVGGVVALTLYLFFGTLSPPKKKS